MRDTPIVPNILGRLCVCVVLGAIVPAGAGCALERSTVQAVDAVDLTRYAGDWFEIARFPNRFQDECAGDVRATYVARPDGRMDVTNRCSGQSGDTIEARGVARVVDAQTRAKLEVRFAPAWLSWLPMVWGDYWVIGLAHDYSWAVVGSPDREYLWILARMPALDWERHSLALATASANGYDVSRLTTTAHASGR